jgi:hypothetical protein
VGGTSQSELLSELTNTISEWFSGPSGPEGDGGTGNWRGATAQDETGDGSPSEVEPVNGRMPINSEYAGDTFPLDKISPELQAKYPDRVQFTPQGFPDFSPYAQAEVQVEGLNGNYQHDADLANEAAGLPETPDGYELGLLRVQSSSKAEPSAPFNWSALTIPALAAR